MSNILNAYMNKIGDTALLSKEEELKLVENLKTDNVARQHLIEANLRLVIFIAKKYMNKGVLFEELVQEGNIGLLQAADKFDVDKGYRFSTYAVWWIKQRIRRAIYNNSRNREVPDETVEETPREVSSALDDLISFEIKEKLDELVSKLLSRGLLDERDITVFKSRAYLEKTLQEIGEDLKITRQRISQIEEKIMSRLNPNEEKVGEIQDIRNDIKELLD